jgi:bacteriorhodopsin
MAGAPAAPPAAATPAYPQAYDAPTRHFLLIGMIGMLLGASFFAFLGLNRKGSRLYHILCFFTAIIGTCCYYALWSGFGVLTKVTEVPHHTLFWGHSLDMLLVTPLLLVCLAFIGKCDFVSMVAILGSDFLMVLCFWVGGFLPPHYKFVWWAAGMVFFFNIMSHLLSQLRTAPERLSPAAADVLKVLTTITAITWCIYPLVWLLGGQGIGSMTTAMEAGLVALTDLVSVVGFGFYLLLNNDSLDDDEAAAYVDSAEGTRPSSELV